MTEQKPSALARRWLEGWGVSGLLITAFMLAPIIAILVLALSPSEPIWARLWATTLPYYLANSVVLMLGVGTFVSIIGVATAWFVAMREFPGRRILEWLLLMPLAVPAYIGAYAFVDFFEFAGVFQTTLREGLGIDLRTLPIRSKSSAIWVLGLSLYPYTYLMVRAALREQTAAAFDVARALGTGPWGVFFRVGLPLVRPAIFVGLAIALMEVLADFGAVEFFAVQTLTTGIFTTWLEAGNASGAAQIASVIFAWVAVLAYLERISRRNLRVDQTARQTKRPHRIEMNALAGIGVATFCFLPVLFGFILPVVIMLNHALAVTEIWFDPNLVKAVFRSVGAAGVAVVICILLAGVLSYGARITRSTWLAKLAPITILGYAAPGAVLGLGILIPLAWVDHRLADVIESVAGFDPGLLLTGTAFAVILAYVIRFFAIAQGGVSAGLGRISPRVGMAGRSLGLSSVGVLGRVYMPMMRISLLTTALLIFVDCVKELPATLLLRPFGYDTLATHVYGFASREDIAGASAGSLLIILVGAFAVMVLARANR